MNEAAVRTERAPLRAWYAAGVLALMYTLSNVDRQILSLLVEPIRADFGASDTMMGLLGGFAFAVFYTFLGIPIARVADRGSRRLVILAGVALWSAATAACGLARSFGALFVARVGVSVGEAALSPAAYSMLSDLFPPSSLGRAMGVYAVGAAVGYGLAYLLGGALYGYFDANPVVLPVVGELAAWQMTFVAVGAPGIVLALLMLSVREPERKAVGVAAPQSQPRAPTTGLLAHLWRERRVFACLFIAVAAYQVASSGFNMWLPTHFVRAFGWTPAEVGVAFGGLFMVGGVIGVLLAGVLGDTMMAGANRPTAYFMLMGWWTMAGTPCLAAASLVADANTALWLLGPGIFLVTGPAVLAPALLQLITPNNMRAQVSAIYLFVVALIGMGCGPLLVGLATDYLFADPQMLKWSIAIVCGGAMALSVVFFFMGAMFTRSRQPERGA